ncbi:MAG: hypothetical protein ACK5V2_18070 [Pseudomonadota bacterium]|jgi:hypothetical protein|nr:hypothetical protein [Rubrivivax sp.]
METPTHFSPGDEPYIGLKALYVFDVLIKSALELAAKLAARTRAGELTELQRAAAQIVPQGLNIALSIRELVRQAHLFPALVLLRSLVERAAILQYLRENPGALPMWERGWNHGERPSLLKMLKATHATRDDEGARMTCDFLNHLVHGDPYAAEYNLVALGEDAWGYGVGRNLTDAPLCDFVCDQSISWLTVLAANANACFPAQPH